MDAVWTSCIDRFVGDEKRRLKMPAFNAPIIDVAAPDSVLQPSTRPSAGGRRAPRSRRSRARDRKAEGPGA
jgi:hypothetical protein